MTFFYRTNNLGKTVFCCQCKEQIVDDQGYLEYKEKRKTYRMCSEKCASKFKEEK
jgi:ribosomal protein L24E